MGIGGGMMTAPFVVAAAAAAEAIGAVALRDGGTEDEAVP